MKKITHSHSPYWLYIGQMLSLTISIGLIGSSLMLTGCGNNDEAQTESADASKSTQVKPDPVKVVNYLTLGAGSGVMQAGMSQGASMASASIPSLTRNLSGTVVAAETTNLSFQSSGQITNMKVKVGDKIQRGQILAELDATNYILQINQATAKLNQAIQQRDKAKIDVTRREELISIGAVSGAELDSVRLALSSAEESVKVAEASAKLIKKQIIDSKLIAPFTGVVIAKLSEVGQLASPSAPVYQVATDYRQDVSLNVPENLLGAISRGQVVDVSFPALPGKPKLKGQVSEISTQAQAGAFPIKIQLQNSGGLIKAGMTAEVSLPLALPQLGNPKANAQFAQQQANALPTADGSPNTDIDGTVQVTNPSLQNSALQNAAPVNVFAVPPSAVAAGDEQRHYVMRIVADGSHLGSGNGKKSSNGQNLVLEQVTVMLAELSGDKAIITGNLQAGDKIVRSGVALLNEGQQVELMGTGAKRINP